MQDKQRELIKSAIIACIDARDAIPIHGWSNETARITRAILANIQADLLTLERVLHHGQ